jgi:carbamoyl-phosphate synthase large subunit
MACPRRANFRMLKSMGFSDARLAELAGSDEDAVRKAAPRPRPPPRLQAHRHKCCRIRLAHRLHVFHLRDRDPGRRRQRGRADDREKIIILGGGPNRIGQGIEFDYCCCHAAFALADAGYETIMINCNPETVSTDYDTSDRLYFEPLTVEDVLEIIAVEQSNGTLKGVIVQFGGQTPLKLADGLERAGVPILGTSPDAIDLAEDRDRFVRLLNELGLKQPENGMARSIAEARRIAQRIGFPVIIRPSYVLGGRAMEIVHDDAQLDRYMTQAVVVSGKNPVLIDRYLSDAIEVDVDALSDGTTWSSPASWSTSRRPASIRATRLAPCRPIPCRPTSSPRSSARRRRWRWGSTWSG